MKPPSPAEDFRALLEEKEMLNAIGRGPDAVRAWLLQQRAQVVELLAEIDSEIEKQSNP